MINYETFTKKKKLHTCTFQKEKKGEKFKSKLEVIYFLLLK